MVPLSYIPNAGSQLERALRGYCIAGGAKPAVLDPDGAPSPNNNIFLTLELEDRAYIGRTILAHDAAEDVNFSGRQVFAVDIVDQFPALPPAELVNKEAHRVAIDRQVGKMMRLMSVCADGDNDFRETAARIQSAGRALFPTSFTITQCGDANARGVYNYTSDTLWTHATSGYTATFNDDTSLWELQDASEVVQYTATLDNFPAGDWTREAGTGTAPVVKVDNSWNNYDMREFSCFWVAHTGHARGNATDGEQIIAGVWREVRRFAITVAPMAID